MNQRDVIKPYRQDSSRYAPSYNIPSSALVDIEHPFIINDMEKAIDSLGGASNVLALSHPDNYGSLAKLYLRPKDSMCKPILSANVETNNILLKVSVPKRTGLKRRWGSCGPYHEGIGDRSSPYIDTFPQKRLSSVNTTRFLLRSLRDNVGNYSIQPLGSINQTHRFRSMPDFAFSTVNSPFMKKMREDILPFQYEKLKNFQLDMSKGPQQNTDLIPPPRWSHITLPFNYSYAQNPGVRQVVDFSGKIRTENSQKPQKPRNQPIAYDSPYIPTKPADDLPPIASLEPAMQRLIRSAQTLFEERPIWTRRALRNCVSASDYDEIGANAAKYMYQYVGYIFESGPWRDAVVKFGVDPRKDPSLRIYQTMMFILDTEYNDSRRKAKELAKDRVTTNIPNPRETHVFSGTHVSLDGKVWQVCDVVDPLLRSLLSTTNIRNECHIQADGWYHSGTWAKAKIIMKAKITSILASRIPNDGDYTRIIHELPDKIHEENLHLCYFPRNSATTQEVKLASQIRSAARKYQGYDFMHRAPENDQNGKPLSAYGYRQKNKITVNGAKIRELSYFSENDDESESPKDLEGLGESEDLNVSDDLEDENNSFLLDPLLFNPQVGGRMSDAKQKL